MAKYRSAKVLLFDANGHVLVLRRSGTHPTSAFEPDLPGGIIEVGESHEVGVAREVFEETRLLITPDQLRMVDITRRPFAIMQRTLFIAQLDQVRPTIEISWEHDEYSWVPIESITKLEQPVQKRLNKIIKKKLHKSDV